MQRHCGKFFFYIFLMCHEESVSLSHQTAAEAMYAFRVSRLLAHRRCHGCWWLIQLEHLEKIAHTLLFSCLHRRWWGEEEAKNRIKQKSKRERRLRRGDGRMMGNHKSQSSRITMIVRSSSSSKLLDRIKDSSRDVNVTVFFRSLLHLVLCARLFIIHTRRQRQAFRASE